MRLILLPIAMGLIAASPLGDAPMPAKAQVTYQGIFKFTESKRQRQPRRLNLNTMLSSAMAGSGGTTYEGAITIKAKFDGAAVTADISGTGGIASIRLSGLIRDGICRLTDSRAAVVYEGRCGTAGFVGTISGTERYRNILRGSFSAQATQFVDVAEKEAETAARKAVVDARRAELKKLCDAGKMTACVEMDTLGQ